MGGYVRTVTSNNAKEPNMSSNMNPVGKSFRFDLGGLRVNYSFDAHDKASFVVENGAGLAPDGHAETVAIELTEIRPGVFLNSWVEASGATVSHLEDFETGTVHSNVSIDGQIYRFNGTIIELDSEDLATRNKNTVLTAMRELFAEKDVSAVDRYWAEPYVQHNPTMPNGLDGLRSIVPMLEGFSWTPARIVAEGDLVITHSRVLGWAPEPVIIVDIFRLQDGKIVEHWDVVQNEVEAADSVNGNQMV